MATKKYHVELFKYPEEFDIEAESKEEAIRKAKQKVSFGIWESKARRSN